MKRGIVFLVFGILMIIFISSVNALTGISTCPGLQNMKNNLAESYYLMNEIDCSVFGSFDRVGHGATPFTGTLDGKGFKIIGLTINTGYLSETGLFGTTSSATIKNVKLVNVGITMNSGSHHIGSLIGEALGNTNVENCSATGSLNVNLDCTGSAGGLIGYASGAGTIKQSFANVNVNVNHDCKDWLGTCVQDWAAIGGFIGTKEDATWKNIENSYSRGFVNDADSCSFIGGFAGWTEYTNFINSYSTGQILNGQVKGGFLGYCDGNCVCNSNCFWDTTTSGQSSTVCSAIGKTTAQMKTKSTFTNAGWDFTKIWYIAQPDGTDYPKFRWSLCGDGTCDSSVGENCLTCLADCGCSGGTPTCCGTSCVNTQTNIDNCGSCTRICSSTNVLTRTCAASLCTSSCISGFGNCIKPASPALDDGCETNLNINVDRCGFCTRACSAIGVNHVVTRSCSSAKCSFTCDSGWGNCNSALDPTPDDGCERSLTTVTDCGGCGIACAPGQTCESGVCGGVSGVYWKNMINNNINSSDLNDVVKISFTGAGLSQVTYRIKKIIVWWPDSTVASILSTQGYVYWHAGSKQDGTLESGKYYAEAKRTTDTIWASTVDNPNPDYRYLLVSNTEINTPPVANITSPKTGEIYLNSDLIEFNQSSYDEDDNFYYTWIYDGKIRAGDSVNYKNYSFYYSYTSSGQKVVRLEVVDDRREDDFDEKSIFVINPNVVGNYVFAYISEPESGKNVIGPLVKFNATKSFAIEVASPFALNCLGGMCPAQTSGKTPTNILDPYEKKGKYNEMNFSWSFDDSDRYSALGINGTNFTKIFGKANEHSAELTVNLNGIISSAETHFNVQLFNFCESDGLTFWDSGGNRYNTLTNSNPGCYGKDGIINTNDDCCPGNYYCTTTGCSLNKEKQKFCTNVSFCSDYRNRADCEKDNCTIGSDLLCGEIKNANPACGDDFFVKTNCSCKWDSSLSKCELNANVHGSVFQEGNEINYLCKTTVNHGECMENGFMRVEKISTLEGLPVGCDLSDSLCTNDEGTVVCGEEKINLPFFTFANFIISIVCIGFIYILFRKKFHE